MYKFSETQFYLLIILVQLVMLGFTSALREAGGKSSHTESKWMLVKKETFTSFSRKSGNLWPAQWKWQFDKLAIVSSRNHNWKKIKHPMRIMDIIFYFGVTTDLLILVKRDLKTLGGDFIPFSGADLGGGCRGCAPPPPPPPGTGGGGGGAPPPPPPDDLRFSNTTGILQKKLCGLLVLK